MKTAIVSAMPAGEAAGFVWTWRCAADNAVSAKPFAFYFDCVSDARNRGYEVELARAGGTMSPTGSGYALRGAD